MSSKLKREISGNNDYKEVKFDRLELRSAYEISAENLESCKEVNNYVYYIEDSDSILIDLNIYGGVDIVGLVNEDDILSIKRNIDGKILPGISLGLRNIFDFFVRDSMKLEEIAFETVDWNKVSSKPSGIKEKLWSYLRNIEDNSTVKDVFTTRRFTNSGEAVDFFENSNKIHSREEGNRKSSHVKYAKSKFKFNGNQRTVEYKNGGKLILHNCSINDTKDMINNYNLVQERSRIK